MYLRSIHLDISKILIILKEKKLTEKRHSNQIELHVKEINKTRLEIKVKTHQISDIENNSKRKNFLTASKK